MHNHKKNIKLIKPQAVLFDTDNTLYDYLPANKAAEKAACKKAENLLGINSKTFYEYFYKARNEVKKNISHTASGHSRLLYFQRMIELLGFKAQLLLALDLEQTFWRTFLVNASLFSGVTESLLFLKKKNIPIGVVTDLTAHIQLRKLTYFGLEDTFDAIVTSEEIGQDKPDKRNFIYILKKLSLDQNCEFWMIGDDAKADIKGAKDVGAKTFQKLHNGVNLGENELQPDFSFKSYWDFLRFLKSLI